MKTIEIPAEILQEIMLTKKCLGEHGKSYFRRPEETANARRMLEKLFALNYHNYTFIFDGNEWEIEYRYEQSCKHVYFNLRIWKNAQKSNITGLLNVAKQISKSIGIELFDKPTFVKNIDDIL